MLKRILLVEDDADIRNLVCAALGEAAGYTIEACASATQAYEAAPAFFPDLILLDVMMPGIDGPAALTELRRLHATRHTPVVFMTAKVQSEDLARYRELGGIGVIAKPFDPLLLPGTLEACWSEHRPPLPGGFAAEFEELRRQYLHELPARIQGMKAAADAVAGGGWDRGLLQSLHHETHRLAGSSGLYRMPGLSRAAAVVEEALNRRLTGPWPPATDPAELATLVKALDRLARSEGRLASATTTRPPGTHASKSAAPRPRRSSGI